MLQLQFLRHIIFKSSYLMTGVPLPRLLGYRGPEVSCADVGDSRGEPVVVVTVVAVGCLPQGELE